MLAEALWKILAFIIAVILIFIAPLMTMYDRQEAITYSVVSSAVSEFTDVTREIGGVREQNLNKLLATLSATGNTYDVQLEHYKKVYVPVLDATGNPTKDYYISYEGNFNGDIYTSLESAGTYKLKVGDMFFVQVENRSKTKGQVAKDILFNMDSRYPTIIVRNGGMIRHESN